MVQIQLGPRNNKCHVSETFKYRKVKRNRDLTDDDPNSRTLENTIKKCQETEYLDLFNETQMLAVRKSIRRKDGKPKIGQKENSRNDE